MILFAINNPKPVPEYDFEANFEKIKIKIKNPSLSFDDDKIAYLSLVNRFIEAKAVCYLLLTGISKYDLTSADHHGYPTGCEMETIQ